MTGQPLPAPSSVTVSVMNGTGASNQASDTATALTSLGYHTVGIGDTTPVGDVAETYVYYGSRDAATEAAAESVSRSMIRFGHHGLRSVEGRRWGAGHRSDGHPVLGQHARSEPGGLGRRGGLDSSTGCVDHRVLGGDRRADTDELEPPAVGPTGLCPRGRPDRSGPEPDLRRSSERGGPDEPVETTGHP